MGLAMTLDDYLELVETACPGACNKPFWRVHRAALDELTLANATKDEPVPYEPDQAIVESATSVLHSKAPHWCRDCQEEIRAAVVELPDLAWSCRVMPDGRLAPPPPSEIHAKAVAPPSPSPAWDAWEAVARWLLDRVMEIADDIGVKPPLHRKVAGGVELYPDSFARWLSGHWPAVMSADDAPRVGTEALDLHARTEKAAGRDPLVHHLPLACMQCDRKALQRKDGKEIVECRACHKKWNWEDYERLSVAYRESLRGVSA